MSGSVGHSDLQMAHVLMLRHVCSQSCLVSEACLLCVEQRYSHVLKTDDDCYVRASKLVNLVKKLASHGESMLYAGRQVYIQIS